MSSPHRKFTLTIIVFSLLLNACSFTATTTTTPEPTPDLNAIASQVAAKVVAGLTATAAAWTQTPTITPTPTSAPLDATLESTATPTQTETSSLAATNINIATLAPTLTLAPASDPASFNACYNSELVSDITVPRGEEFLPGSKFDKIWEIKNIGTCTWNTNYSITFGYSTPIYDFYNVATSFNKSEVKQGETVQVTITIQLPTGYPAEGAYNIGYRLANDKGYNFGAWFFVYVNITPPTATP